MIAAQVAESSSIEGTSSPRVARTWRRPSRENETSPLVIASAIPAGSQRIRRASQWIEHIEAAPGFALMRADAQRNMLAVAYALLHRSDRLHLTRPTWGWLQDTTGLSRASVARYIARLREWGLLATVAPGRRGIFAPGGSHARLRPGAAPIPATNGEGQPANDAAVYVLCEPATKTNIPIEEPDDETSVDISETPPPYRVNEYPRTRTRAKGSPNSWPLRGPDSSFRAAARLQGGAAWRHLDPWPLSVTPSSQDNRLAAAGEVQSRLPVLRRISTKHVRALLRPFFLAGWTPRDVIEAVDHRPDGTKWPHYGAKGVDNVGAWLTYRLNAWRSSDGQPHRSPTKRREAARAHEQARTRALLEAQHEAAQRSQTPKSQAAAAQFFAWWNAHPNNRGRKVR